MGSNNTQDGFLADISPAMEELDAHFVDCYRGLHRAATRRNTLDARTRELIGLALNASVASMYLPAVRHHMQAALKAGATTVQVLQTLQLTSVLGIHAITVGLPVILEELGVEISGEFDAERNELKEDFVSRRGSWTPLWNSLLQLDPDFFKAYTDFSGAPWNPAEGGLDAKTRELIYVAIDASTNHLMVPGIRAHAANAIRYGATNDELLEVLELTSLIGMQTYIEGCRAYIEASKVIS